MPISLNDVALSDSSGVPPKLVLYGEGGVGKTTLAAEFPDPIFLPTEAGTIGLDGVASFPLLTDFEDVLDALRALYRDPHQYRTVVIDSVSQMELLVWEATCRRQQPKPWDSIESPGYGRGYAEAIVEWKHFLLAVSSLRERGMLPVLICHQDVRTHTDPGIGTYDQTQIRLHRKAAQLVVEDADILALLAQEVVFSTETANGRDRERKPQGSGRRVLKLSPRPQWQAKCRYRGVPEQLPIELDSGWATLAEAVPAIARHGQPKPAPRKPAKAREAETETETETEEAQA